MCFAAPSGVTHSSGALADGETITITGSSFGTGPTVYKWDDFENGTNGTSLTNGGWRCPDSNVDDPIYSSTESHQRVTGEQVASVPDGTNDFVYDHPSTLPTAFVCFYWKRTYTDPETCCNDIAPLAYNVKYFEVNHDHTSDYYPAVRLNEGGYPLNNELQIWGDNGTDCTGSGTLWHDPIAQSTWTRIDCWIQESSCPGGTFDGTADGFVRIWYTNGSVKHTRITDGDGGRDNITTNINGGTDHWEDVVFGFFCRNGSTCASMWYDDVYIASSPARVEIGDSGTLSSCTHLEVQPATSWSDTSITLTVNQGSFTNGSAVYIYVIDSDGNSSVSSALTIGSSSSPAVSGSGCSGAWQ